MEMDEVMVENLVEEFEKFCEIVLVEVLEICV